MLPLNNTFGGRGVLSWVWGGQEEGGGVVGSEGVSLMNIHKLRLEGLW